MTPRERLLQIVILLIGVIALGTLGYQLLEGWAPFDALYMTVITVSSVGFMEVHQLSPAGRAFTMVLIVIGLGTMAYGLGTITAFWVEGDLSHIWEKRLMERRIATLTGHVIVCGGGETGRAIARELMATRTPFVVIELDAAQEPNLRKIGPDFLYLLGDATDPDVLRTARVEAARGLIACMPSDKDNLFTMLTARELNGQVRIVTRVGSEDSRSKLLRAGADAVVSSKTIGALRLASEMLRPHVVSVLDAMLREPSAVRVEEVPVGAAVAGRALGTLKLQERAGVIVFAMRAGTDRQHVFNPPLDRTLQAGDVLIACADHDQLETMRKIVSGG
ncbi:MAG TPA: NAD-binding protein [Candidatus Binatia bacterium]|nr:NAD-binding protein [Candidatus Binatia bacterium]